MRANSLTLRCPAKVNLCLSVLGRRTDGYHDVEMVMQMVGLYDEVTVALTGSGDITVQCDDSGVPSGEGNIVYRAAEELLRHVGKKQSLAISIAKRIPVAAGLGGGSGNAAAVLAALNRLLAFPLDREHLAAIGARVGMDVPFFFYGPTALACGRGEILTPLAPFPTVWVLLVNPGIAVSTAWVYNNINFGLTKKVDCNKIAGLSVRQLAQRLHNDLEVVTASAHPVIREIQQALLAQGAMGSRMSGSGSTVFGIFENEAACRSAAQNLISKGWRLYPVEMLTESPIAEHLPA